MRARLASPGAFLAALCVLACQDDTVECLQDDRCPSGAYCRNTRCIEPGADGGVMEVYRSRVLPLIEAGCNCHGPASDRPWRFDHRTEESTAASLAELRNWMYNPRHAWRARLPDAEPPPEPPEGAIDRFALVGYASAQCGFEHPLIWPPGAPQNVELAAWFARAIDAIDRPPPLPETPMAPLDVLTEGPLPEREQALYTRAVAVTAGLDADGEPPMPPVFEPIDGYTVADGRLAARVSGQCGCCHVPPRAFVVPPFDPAQGWVAHGQETFCDMDRVMPGHLTRYGLGTSGAARHPVVYADLDDPRLRLLVKWFDHIDRTRPPLDAGAPPDPCNPPVDAEVEPDLGPDLGDGDVGPPPDPAEVALAAYMGPIGRLLEQRCGNGFCHDVNSPSFPHPYPFADEDAARAQLRRLLGIPGLLDRDAPRGSGLIRVGEGNHATNLGGQAFSAADVDRLVEWIGGIPPDF